MRAIESATRILTLAPKGDDLAREARSVLARLWWHRLLDMERHHDHMQAALCRSWVEHYDDGALANALDGSGTVDITCVQAGAVGRLYRWAEQGRVREPVLDGEYPMPIEDLQLSPGSWLLEVSAPGFQTARYPLYLERLEHHEGRVRLFRSEEVGEGWVVVPAGRFVMGGDPKARQPLQRCRPWVDDLFVMKTCVTSEDWLRYLNALPIEEAMRRVPGEGGLFGSSAVRYWSHGEQGWSLPEGWQPDWPVFAVSHDDAVAYAQWLSADLGRAVRLPTEEEWEKCARGVDGRSYPWGDKFDPTFAHMRRSRPGRPRPWSVGQYPVDTSVYGAMDMAGGLRELTSSWFDEGQIVIRGGTWGDDADDLRCACRAGLQPDFRYSFIGFRLVSEEPCPSSATPTDDSTGPEEA